MKKLKNFTINALRKFTENSGLIGISMLTIATLLLAIHQFLGITSNAPLTISALLIIIGVVSIVWQMKHSSRY